MPTHLQKQSGIIIVISYVFKLFDILNSHIEPTPVLFLPYMALALRQPHFFVFLSFIPFDLEKSTDKCYIYNVIFFSTEVFYVTVYEKGDYRRVCGAYIRAAVK